MDPPSATCTRGREAGKSKGGSFSLLIWLLWHHTCCLVGLPVELVLFCPSLRIAAEPGLPFPFPLCRTQMGSGPRGSCFFKLTSQPWLPHPAASRWHNPFSRFSGGRGNYRV